MTKSYSIDAKGRALGRVATEAANALMGKTSPDFTPHHRPSTKVTITNASQVRVAEKKRIAKTYLRYSGYPGGLKRETYSSLSSRKGHGAALRLAISRMLPRNASRAIRMKNLTIHE